MSRALGDNGDCRASVPYYLAMARGQRGYRCTSCGWQTIAYAGRCGHCGEWNTLEAFDDAPRAAGPRARAAVAPGRTVPLSVVADDEGERISTEIPEFDRVLGGGFVPGGLILVGG